MRGSGFWLLVALAVSVLDLAAVGTPLVDHFLSRAQTIAGREYEVLRMHLDLTGDEEPELLVGMGGRISWWFVYEKVSDSEYRFLDDLEFSELMFRIDRDPTRIVMRFATGGDVTTVIKHFDGVGFVDCEAVGSADCRDAREDFATWRKKVGLRVLATRLDTLREPAPEWRDVLDPGAEPEAFDLAALRLVD